MEKKHFFMVNQFYRAKVEKMSLKFIRNNKFDYFCSVNWDNCMDGKAQTPQEKVDAILAEYPQKASALDNQFEGNCQLKTNTAFQMRDAGVEFRKI
jgi:hypothetical protein